MDVILQMLDSAETEITWNKRMLKHCIKQKTDMHFKTGAAITACTVHCKNCV